MKESFDYLVVTDEGRNLRIITETNIVWMLVVGWIFYLCSLLLSLVYYLMHPSSPEMWTWRRRDELEVWSPPEVTEEETDGNLVSV